MLSQLGTGVMLLLIILIVVVLVLILAIFIMSRSLKRMEKKYNRFMRGLDGTSLEKEFEREFKKMDNYRLSQKSIADHIADVEKYQKSSFTKYGIVKYDAFEDVGGKLSFALALLDESDTGFVLNAIHSKDNCFLYLKEIVNGESYIMLSTEEVNALLAAKDFRRDEFEEREQKKNAYTQISLDPFVKPDRFEKAEGDDSGLSDAATPFEEGTGLSGDALPDQAEPSENEEDAEIYEQLSFGDDILMSASEKEIYDSEDYEEET